MSLRRIACVVLLGLVCQSVGGCIYIIDHGTRGGRISKLAGLTIQKGDKKEDVITRLGEPDETASDGGSSEYITYKSCSGGYYVVYGQFEYFVVRAHLVDGKVDRVFADEMGKDLVILGSCGVGIPEGYQPR
jgi:hypothetical protein